MLNKKCNIYAFASSSAGSSSARSSSSDMGSRIPTPNSGPAAPRGGGLKAPGQRNSIGASISNDKSRGPSPVPNSYGGFGRKNTLTFYLKQIVVLFIQDN